MAKKKTSPAKSKRAIAVVLSDLHMSLKFIEPASTALDQAIMFANELNIRLIVPGDFHDTKAIHRGECIEVARELLRKAQVKPILLVGNHDKVNEKSEKHALHCYDELASVINVPMEWHHIHFIPYCHDKDTFLAALAEVPSDAQLIVHQGIAGAEMGEYVADRSQVDPAVFDRFTKPVYSGHYHKKQTVGNFTYFGTPFTTSFSEANDGAKGFHVLYDDGSIELMELNLRRHVIVTTTPHNLSAVVDGVYPPETLLWVKMEGTAQELSAIKKADVGMKLLGHANFKLEKIKTDSADEAAKPKATEKRAFSTIMSDIIADDKIRKVWKELNETA